MRALILETSTEKSCLCLAEDSVVLKHQLLSGGPNLSKTLAVEAHSLLAGEPIDFILVGQGPGSYTGIRVAAALAKGLSIGWNIPLYGFCSLKAFTPPIDGPFAVVVDARIGGFYVLLGTREGDLVTWSPPQVLKLVDAPLILKAVPLVSSPHPLAIERRLPECRCLEAFIDPHLLAKEAFGEGFKGPLELSYLTLP